MTSSYFKVVRVVGWGYLNATCTIFHINIGICNYRDFPTYKWQNQIFTNLIFKSFVFWIYCNSQITKHSFRTSCSNGNKVIAIFVMIFNIPKFTFLVFVINFCIRNSCFCHWIPVYNPVSSIYQTIIIHFLENSFDSTS